LACTDSLRKYRRFSGIGGHRGASNVRGILAVVRLFGVARIRLIELARFCGLGAAWAGNALRVGGLVWLGAVGGLLRGSCGRSGR